MAGDLVWKRWLMKEMDGDDSNAFSFSVFGSERDWNKPSTSFITLSFTPSGAPSLRKGRRSERVRSFSSLFWVAKTVRMKENNGEVATRWRSRGGVESISVWKRECCVEWRNGGIAL